MRRFWKLGLVLGAAAAGACSSSVVLEPDGAEVLDSALEAALADTDLPGVVALVTTRDSVIYRTALGFRGPDRAEPLLSDDLFQFHSMTKPITSVALMMLVDRGLVDLDAPVSRYLADFAGREVLVDVDTVANLPITRPPSREISVRDLLRHTSGFGYPFSNQELLTLALNGGFGFRDQPILHDPGERWTYGMGTAVVGWIVEEVSGKTLPEFFESEMFTVLGMGDTSFEVPPDRMNRLVDYMRRTNGVLVADPVPDSVVGEVRGDHGLFSTADDYARFLRLILNDGTVGSRRLLSRRSIDELSHDQLLGMTVTEQPGAMPALSHPFPIGAGSDGFSLGFQVSVEEEPGRRAPGSLTWAGLANTHFWIDPDTGVGVVLLFQVLPFYDEAVLQVMDRFERALYEEALAVG